MKANRLFKRTNRDLWLFRFVALIIAVLLWLTVLGGERYEINKVIYLEYQVPDHLVISNSAPREIVLRVAGPQAFIKDYESRRITRTIDLTKSQQGEYEVSLIESMFDLPLGLHMISISQESVVVRLDRAAWKRVPVRAAFVGTLPEGFRVINVTMKPSTVEVRGPETRLRSLDSLSIEGVTLASDSLVQEFDAKINLRDHPGIFIDEQSQLINLTVQLEGSLLRKSIDRIPIRVRFDGSSGRRIVNLRNSGIQLSPENVTFLLEGPDEVMKDLTRQQIDVWAQISDTNEGTQRVRLDWGLPPGVRVLRRSSDWVEVVLPKTP